MSDAPVLTSAIRRRYRLAQAIVVVGSLSIGTLLVNLLVERLREQFFFYYGLSESRFEAVREVGSSGASLELGHISIAIIAVVGMLGFYLIERHRLRMLAGVDGEDDSLRCSIRSERPGMRVLFDLFIMRTSIFAGVLLMIWMLQTCFERWTGGAGWGLEYASWQSLLPLASVFGVCVLAGMVVALASLIGLRAIHVLEWALRTIRRAVARNVSRRRPASWMDVDRIRTFRDLFGCEILSRPPPCCA